MSNRLTLTDICDMAVSNPLEHKYLSTNFFHDPAGASGAAGLIVGWTLAGFAFVGSMWALPYHFAVGVALLIVSALLSLEMWLATRQHLFDEPYRFELVIRPSEILLYTYDCRQKTQRIDSAIIRHIRSARLSSQGGWKRLLLSTDVHNIDIPLWAFGRNAQQIIDELRARNILIRHAEPSTVNGASLN